MFHPHFFRLLFGNVDTTADAIGLISAYKIELDLQRAWEEQNELSDYPDAGDDNSTNVKPRLYHR